MSSQEKLRWEITAAQAFPTRLEIVVITHKQPGRHDEHKADTTSKNTGKAWGISLPEALGDKCTYFTKF